MKFFFKYFGGAFLLGLLFIITTNLYVTSFSDGLIFSIENTPDSDVGIVLGASVLKNGDLSDILKDRTLTAVDLYFKDKKRNN